MRPAPTLLRDVSPRGQEGFTSSSATLRCVLPSSPRRNRTRLSASVLPDVRCLRPTASLPGLSAGFVRRYRAVLSSFQRVSSASRLPGRYRVEIFTRWVAPPLFWSRRCLELRTIAPFPAHPSLECEVVCRMARRLPLLIVVRHNEPRHDECLTSRAQLLTLLGL